MIEILIALIAAVFAFTTLLRYGAKTEDDLLSVISILFGAGGLVVCAICFVVYMFVAWDWFAAEAKARIINREYGTNYTREEVFYASKVIETIQHLNRQRIEINGNLFREKKDEKK